MCLATQDDCQIDFQSQELVINDNKKAPLKQTLNASIRSQVAAGNAYIRNVQWIYFV